MTEQALLETISKLPEHLHKEVLDFAEFLYYRELQSRGNSRQLPVRHGYGSWNGKIVMSDDFDDPLEDLQEYC